LKKSVLIITGGGPAPGINTVIGTIVKIFLEDGYKVFGVHEGYKGLFSDEPKVKEFTFDHADGIYRRGGSTLTMSRFKPKDRDFNKKIFEDYNVKLLVTIGGDDTASTANRITAFLADNNLDIKNIHVPKTIDNDLPLPNNDPTFGYHSAKDEGVKISNTVYEDARTSHNWFVLSTMGRSAGHLAFGIASACHLPMMIIPEMFNKAKPTLQKIINLIISSMIKRRLMGIDYGVALISEGVFHVIDEDELKNSGIFFTYDAHGHPELGNVSKSNIFNVLVQDKLKTLGLDIKSRPVELGYELRCGHPTGFDLSLCTLLGIGVKKLYDDGITGCIVTANSRGDISPMYLSDFQNEDGVILPRLVDIDSQSSKLFMMNLHYIGESDYKGAKAFLEDPAAYDFHKILNW
jgi:6-phosphofructokinase